MPVYRVYAKVRGSKYIGDFEADSLDEAIQMAYEHDNCAVSVCHHCAKQIGDAECHIDQSTVDQIEELE